MEFLLDGGEGAAKKAARIGHDGAAARRDLVGGEEFVEFAEDVVDVHGGMELLDATDEGFGEVAGVLLEANGGVAEAEPGCRIGDGHAAAASAGSAGGAVRWDEFDFFEDSGLFVHESFLSGEWGRSKMGIVWVHPR